MPNRRGKAVMTGSVAQKRADVFFRVGQFVERLYSRGSASSGWKCVLAVTGGGVSTLEWLLGTPGASSFVLEASSPYSQAAARDYACLLGRHASLIPSSCSTGRRERCMGSTDRVTCFSDRTKKAEEVNKKITGGGGDQAPPEETRSCVAEDTEKFETSTASSYAQQTQREETTCQISRLHTSSTSPTTEEVDGSSQETGRFDHPHDDLSSSPSPSTPFCSAHFSRQLALRCLLRAIELIIASPEGNQQNNNNNSSSSSSFSSPEVIVGVAATAALRTSRPKRGGHRAFVTTTTLGQPHLFETYFVQLGKDGQLSRTEEDRLVSQLVLKAIAKRTQRRSGETKPEEEEGEEGEQEGEEEKERARQDDRLAAMASTVATVCNGNAVVSENILLFPTLTVEGVRTADRGNPSEAPLEVTREALEAIAVDEDGESEMGSVGVTLDIVREPRYQRDQQLLPALSSSSSSLPTEPAVVLASSASSGVTQNSTSAQSSQHSGSSLCLLATEETKSLPLDGVFLEFIKGNLDALLWNPRTNLCLPIAGEGPRGLLLSPSWLFSKRQVSGFFCGGEKEPSPSYASPSAVASASSSGALPTSASAYRRLCRRSTDGGVDVNDSAQVAIVLAGSFNPLHKGHLQLALAAAKRHSSRHVFFELTCLNADKGQLAVCELSDRLSSFRNVLAKNEQSLDPQGVLNSSRLLLTREPLFEGKTRLLKPLATPLLPTYCSTHNTAPSASHSDSFATPFCLVYALGFDTFERLLDKKYYGNSVPATIRSLSRLYSDGVRVVVAPRTGSGQNLSEDAKLVWSYFPDMFDVLTDFRVDISSTEIRRQLNTQRRP